MRGGNPASNTGICYTTSGVVNVNGHLNTNGASWRYSTEEVCNDGTVAQRGNGGCASVHKEITTCETTSCPFPDVNCVLSG